MGPIKVARGVLDDAVQSVPAVKYALAVAGLAAAAFIASTFFRFDLGMAFVAVLGTMLLMFLVMLFAVAAKRLPDFRTLAVLLAYAYSAFGVAIPALLISSVFAKVPLDLSDWIMRSPPSSPAPTTTAEPGAKPFAPMSVFAQIDSARVTLVLPPLPKLPKPAPALGPKATIPEVEVSPEAPAPSSPATTPDLPTCPDVESSEHGGIFEFRCVCPDGKPQLFHGMERTLAAAELRLKELFHTRCAQ